MTNYNELLNDVITLHAISNEAERIYTECPESEPAERAFGEAYKAEFEAGEAVRPGARRSEAGTRGDMALR